MSNKRLSIPVALLSQSERVGFLEFFIEPAETAPRNQAAWQDPFRGLAQPGLEPAIAAARRAWDVIPPPVPFHIAVVNPMAGLTNSSGAALGLALCPFLAAPDSPYGDSIVMGSLDFGGAEPRIGKVDHLPAKLRAIRTQGPRTTPTLLLFADDGDPATARETLELLKLNITVRPVETLREACRACMGEGG